MADEIFCRPPWAESLFAKIVVYLLSFLESVPGVESKLKTPLTADRKFEDVVKSAQNVAVLVLAIETK